MVDNRIINGEGTVFIDDEITDVMARNTSRLILDLKAEGITPKVNINSIGGNVFAGFQIIDSLLNVEVDTHISGLAASIAAIIALHGSHRTANDVAIMMLHKASGSNATVVEMVNKTLRNLLETRTRLPKEKVEEIFDEGKDLFFDADEMLAFGLVDDIKRTDRRKKMDHSTFNCKELWGVFNKLNLDTKMIEIKNVFNLKENATEQDVLNKIEDIKNEAKEALEMATDLEKENTELTNRLETSEEALKEASKKLATNLVKTAIDSGKIKKEDTESWVDLAITDYGKAEKLIQGIVTDHSNHVVDSFKRVEKEDLTKDSEKLKAFMRSPKAAELKAENEELFNTYTEAYLKL